MGSLFNWIYQNWVEVAAASISIIYVILSVKEMIWLWFVGFLSAFLYAWVYAKSGFYAGMALQAYYAVISIYGWIHWSKNSRHPDSETDKKLPISHANLKKIIILIFVWMVLWALIGVFLDHVTDSVIPYWDAFAASGGIVATWMLARKILEQWIFWFVIDSVSIGLYVWQGLYATSVLCIVYTIMAVFGYLRWRKKWLERA